MYLYNLLLYTFGPNDATEHVIIAVERKKSRYLKIIDQVDLLNKTFLSQASFMRIPFGRGINYQIIWVNLWGNNAFLMYYLIY